MLSILKLANFWGNFISRKLCKPFNPIPYPKGYERQRLIEAYYKKSLRRRTPSDPILPDHLNAIKKNINLKNFNWLYLSVWLGLRPQEIDSLMDKNTWRIEVLATGRKVYGFFKQK